MLDVTRNARQRRFRARLRAGEVVVTVSLSPEETDKLCRLRCLDAHQLEDRAAIADAIHLLLTNISGV